ncbi:MAG: hypothetical protein Q9215_004315 [Flavoplaca cf. flavocitrina]
MDPCQSSDSKRDTYGSNTGTDSKYVLDSDVRPIPSGDFASKDEAELAVQGKKQQTNRNFGFIGILSFSCLLMLTWEAMFTNFLSYMTGWQSTIAWQAAVASSGLLSGTIIQGMLVLAYPSYTFQSWHGTLLLYAVLVVALIFNTFLGRYLSFIESAIFVIHIVGIFAIIIPIAYLAPQKSSAHDVFVLFLDTGGYNNKGLAFFVGIIATVFAFAGPDGAVHMCEEIQNASTVVPWAMVGTIAVNGLLGFAMVIFLLFCLGDIDKALASPTKYPFIEIFYQGVRNSTAGAIALVSLIEVLLIFCCISIMATSSRMMWAFARDKGLPGWQYLSRIEPHTKLPIFALIATTTITLFIALINIGSTAALSAVLSLAVSGGLGSYIPPMALILYHRLSPKHAQNLHFGPWRLGKWGAPINAFALVWTVVALFFSFWPTSVPVTAVTMNWSCLLYGGITLFGVSDISL